MSTIKEYREFFLRNVPVNIGTKPDQEVGFPTTYTITVGTGLITVYNRFLKDDYPSENVFKKLFESVTFKLNKEDTSTLTSQGLGLIATDNNARTRTDNASNTFTAFVVPYQLPNVRNDIPGASTIDSSVIYNGINVDVIKVIETVSLVSRNKRDFRIGVLAQDSIVIDGATHRIKLSGDASAPGNSYYYGTDGTGIKGYNNLATFIGTIIPTGIIVMWSGVSIPTGWFLCDGTNGTPDLRGRFIVSKGQNATPAAGDSNPTYAIGSNGGENTHLLTYNEIPKHSHSNIIPKTSADGVTTTIKNGGATSGNIIETSENNVYSDNTGGTESLYSRHENRPPYYALAFIMKQ